jgi:hypothetical protein
MLDNLLHEDQELKRVALTPNDQKPRFEWSALTRQQDLTPPAIKVRVGQVEKDFDLGEIAESPTCCWRGTRTRTFSRIATSSWCSRSPAR